MSKNFVPILVERPQLFYQSYRYSIRFICRDLNIIRGLPSCEKIGEIAQFRSFYLRRAIDQYQVDQLCEISKFLGNYKHNSKFVVSGSVGYLYTNDLSLAKKIDRLSGVHFVSVTESSVTRLPGQIAMKSPKWKLRTYFKSKKLTTQQWSTLADFLKHRPNIRLGPGFEKCLYDTKNTYAFPYLYNSFFIDYNDPGELLFLNIAVPGITGRTLSIVAK